MLALLSPLASLLKIETSGLIAHYKREAIVWSIVGAFLAIGFIFLLVAATNGLSLQFGPVVAPLIMAGTALVLALGVYLASLVAGSAARRAETEARHSAETTALVTSAAIAAAPMILRSSALRKAALPMGGAIAAAYLLSKPRSHRDH
jgi:hypothetical protein